LSYSVHLGSTGSVLGSTSSDIDDVMLCAEFLVAVSLIVSGPWLYTNHMVVSHGVLLLVGKDGVVCLEVVLVQERAIVGDLNVEQADG
jgi:hypothetical protein